MRRLLLAAAASALATSVEAGGLDLSGQPVTLLFHDGDYAELALGATAPRVTGRAPDGASSGNAFGTVSDLGLGVVHHFGPRWSGALILDRPYDVRVSYADAGPAFPFVGTHAASESLGITALARYRIDTHWSVHGGLRAERFGGEAVLAGPGYGPLSGYDWQGDPTWGLGYVLGGAFEIPAVALRVALTYGSEIHHALAATENYFGPTTTDVTMPQSVNLDFQTGVAPDTLLYGLVRWVNWAGWSVEPAGLYAATGLPLISFTSDSYTYRVGLARVLTDTLSAAVEITHETAKNHDTTPLDPYDGFTTLALGGQWRLPSGVELGAGVGYSWLGDATATLPTGATADFDGNHALSGRLRIGIAF